MVMAAERAEYDSLVKAITEEVEAYLHVGDEVRAEPLVRRAGLDVASLIDHTLLRPDASRDEIRKLCEEAVKFGFATVCVNPWNVAQAAEMVRGSRLKVCSVIGFPLGATLTQVKIFETGQVISWVR